MTSVLDALTSYGARGYSGTTATITLSESVYSPSPTSFTAETLYEIVIPEGERFECVNEKS